MDKEMFLNALKERILILDGGWGRWSRDLN